MKYRILGKTGLKISEIGFGTWQLANDNNMWVGATKEESEKAFLTAIDNGINFIDTARVYGNGLSETWIGEFIKNRPNADLVIASKIYPMNWQWPAREGVDIDEVFPVEHIYKLTEESLKALDVDSIDLMQFHVWNDSWSSRDEWKKSIQDLTKQGKVKHWGISTNNHQAGNCIEACKTGLIGSIQTIFNLFDQRPIDELFPYAKENNIGIIARVPLDEGGLTGKINSDTKFEKGDFRNDYFTPERRKELDERVSKLMDFVKDDVKSLAELALRFILSYPEVSSVIPGMRKVDHVIENISLSDKGPLDLALLSELRKHAWPRDFYGKD